MNRDDYLWVAIRVLGLYVLVESVMALVNGLAALPTIFLGWTREPLKDQSPQLVAAGSSMFAVLKAGLLFLLGRYLIRDGTWVVNKVRPWNDAA